MVTMLLGASPLIFPWTNCMFQLYVSIELFFFFHSLAILVKIMMSLAIFFSFALQFYVPVNLLNPILQRR